MPAALQRRARGLVERALQVIADALDLAGQVRPGLLLASPGVGVLLLGAGETVIPGRHRRRVRGEQSLPFLGDLGVDPIAGIRPERVWAFVVVSMLWPLGGL